MPKVTLEDLKIALRLKGKSVTEFAQDLRNPDGETVNRTNVYLALKHGSPKWLLDEIKNMVKQSYKEFPSYYKTMEKQKTG